MLAIPSAAATWASAGNMAIARTGHQAIMLADGRVLVVGGFSPSSGNGGYNTRLAELYDPGTNSWSSTGSTASGRTQHAAARLNDGRVLVVGGVDANLCASDTSVELYDPGTGAWSPTGSVGLARSDPTVTLLADGRVLLAGGGDRCGSVYSTAELYDPSTGTWAPTAGMGTPRERHSAVRLLDGRVLVVGGQTPVGGQFPSVASSEIYDPTTGTWTPTGSMAFTRLSFSLVLLADGRVLAAGGYNGNGFSHFNNGPEVEIYDPATGLWAPTSSTSVARSSGTFVRASDGLVLAAAGNADGATHQASAELWDPGTGTWSPTASLAAARSGASGTLLADGDVLLAGGYDSAGCPPCLSSAERYEATLEVSIDIKPGGFPNSINTGKKGIIPVAVLGTTFDASDVDPSTVCFGDAEDASQRDCTVAPGTRLQDVNADTIPDLILHFETQQTGIDPGDTQACLTGELFDGTSIEGCDSIRAK